MAGLQHDEEASSFAAPGDEPVKRRARASFTSTSVLVLMLILTLGSIGVVNGLWSKNLTIDATVQTGDINADWVEIITTGDSAAILALVLPSCDAAVGGVGDDSQFGDQVAYVVITEAAPGYSCDIKASLSNTGSVPFNIIGINGVLDAANDQGLSFEDLNGIEPGVCELLDEVGNTTADPVDPGEEGIVHCKVVVDPSAQPGWTYYFAIEVCVAQWNESADFDTCKNPTSGTHEGPDEPVLPAPGPTA